MSAERPRTTTLRTQVRLGDDQHPACGTETAVAQVILGDAPILTVLLAHRPYGKRPYVVRCDYHGAGPNPPDDHWKFATYQEVGDWLYNALTAFHQDLAARQEGGPMQIIRPHDPTYSGPIDRP